jgi:cell wall-associated NlpC family hydrolase
MLDVEELERLARSFVGTPYLWGGVSSFGFDCSGFVQRLFHYCFNEWLPRDTAKQRRIGQEIALEDTKRGDLCFFPGHVALYIGEGWIVHANRHHNGVSVNRLFEPSDPYGEQLLKDFQEARRITFTFSQA